MLSYDYSISDDSSDSSDAFEAKRLCVELKDIEQAIRDREQLMRGLNRDVWRCVARRPPGRSWRAWTRR